MRSRHRHVQVEVLVQRDLDELVDPVGNRSADLVDRVVVAIVDDGLRARLACQRGLLGSADRGDHVAGILEARQFDRRVSDGSGSARNQHCLARQRTVGAQAVGGRERGYSERGPELERGMVRQRNRVRCWYDGVLGGGAPAAVMRCQQHPDSLPDAVGTDAAADRIDRAGTVLIGYLDHLRLGADAPRDALTRLPVGRVDP